MSVEDYGFALVVLSSEGILAAVLAYPTLKDILVRQDTSLAPLRQFLALGCVLAPVILWVSLWTEFAVPVIGIVLAAAVLNGLGQVVLLAFRIADVRAHNVYKLAGALLGTIIFLVLVPINWMYLPLAYLFSTSLLFIGHRRMRKQPSQQAIACLSRRDIISGWLIYGTQAVLNNLSQHGTRLVIASVMTLADVAIFTKSYMLATGVFFVFSAVMILYEPRLARSARPTEVAQRLMLAVRVLVVLLAATAAYAFVVLVVITSPDAQVLRQLTHDISLSVVSVLFLYIALNAAHAVVNPLVLAMGGRTISLWASLAGSTSLVALLAISGAGLSVTSVAWHITIAQLVTLTTATVGGFYMVGRASAASSRPDRGN